MAEKTVLEIVIAAKDMFTATMNKAQSSMGSLGAAASKLMSHWKALVVTLAGVGYAMYKAIDAAMEQETAEKKLAVSLGYHSQALLDQASALQKVTRFGDEQIIDAQARLAMFIKDENQIKALTRVTLDLAAAKGIDLSSAADLVAKSVGTSTNALARQGVAIEGVAGSSERAASAIAGLNRLFGGQAVAEADTFSGRLSIMKNQWGEVLEEIGNVIIKNQAVVMVMGQVNKVFQIAAEWIKTNRVWLMSLVRDGLAYLIDGLDFAIFGVSRFHKAWLYLKAGVSLAFTGILGLVQGFYNLFISGVLLPFELLFEALKELGIVASNPLTNLRLSVNATFDAMIETQNQVTATTLDSIAAIDDQYAAVSGTLSNLSRGLRDIKDAQLEMQTITPPVSGEMQLPGAKEFAEQQKKQAAAALKLAKLGEAPTGMTPEDEFSKIQLEYQNKLIALNEYNTQRLLLMQEAGYSEAELVAENNRQIAVNEDATNRFRLSSAASTAGAISNVLQNLMTSGIARGKTMFQAMKLTSIAQALISTYEGATAALASKTLPYPLNIAAMIAVIAAGLAQVAKIRSTEPGGGTGGGTAIGAGGAALPAYGGGSFGAYPVPKREEAKPTQNITLQIYNPLSQQNWAEIIENNLLPALKSASDMNIVMNVKTVYA